MRATGIIVPIVLYLSRLMEIHLLMEYKTIMLRLLIAKNAAQIVSVKNILGN